jgi:histidyl-tRNA synthetase
LGIAGYALKLNSIGDAACRPAYVERLSAWLDENDALLDDEARAKRETSPLRVFDVKSERVRKALVDAPKIGDSLCDACREHFAQVRAYLDAYGIAYELEPTLVRGLDYYTRTTFEFWEETQILGGGRYDGLIEAIGGPPTPAIGFGAGIERLLLSVTDLPIRQPEIEFFFAFEDRDRRLLVLPLIAQLRAEGRACETDYAERSLKGQLTQAGRVSAATTVIVSAGQATIRRTGQADEVVPLDELSGRLAG